MVVVVALLVGLALLLLSQAHFRELEALIERDPDAGTSALIDTIRWFIVSLTAVGSRVRPTKSEDARLSRLLRVR